MSFLELLIYFWLILLDIYLKLVSHYIKEMLYIIIQRIQMMKSKQRAMYFHLCQIFMLKKPVSFLNAELNIPHQQFRIFLIFTNTFFLKLKSNYFVYTSRGVNFNRITKKRRRYFVQILFSSWHVILEIHIVWCMKIWTSLFIY